MYLQIMINRSETSAKLICHEWSPGVPDLVGSITLTEPIGSYMGIRRNITGQKRLNTDHD